MKYISDILARKRKRFRFGFVSLVFNYVVLFLFKYCLDFKIINMFFVYFVFNIIIYVLNKLFLIIFWCIFVVEIIMLWCKRSKKKMMLLYIILDECRRLYWGIDLIYSFDLLCFFYFDNERGSCRINKFYVFDYIDIIVFLYV